MYLLQNFAYWWWLLLVCPFTLPHLDLLQPPWRWSHRVSSGTGCPPSLTPHFWECFTSLTRILAFHNLTEHFPHYSSSFLSVEGFDDAWFNVKCMVLTCGYGTGANVRDTTDFSTSLQPCFLKKKNLHAHRKSGKKLQSERTYCKREENFYFGV